MPVTQRHVRESRLTVEWEDRGRTGAGCPCRCSFLVSRSSFKRIRGTLCRSLIVLFLSLLDPRHRPTRNHASDHSRIQESERRRQVYQLQAMSVDSASALTVLGRGWELAVTWQDLEMRLPVAVFESIARPLEAGRTWR